MTRVMTRPWQQTFTGVQFWTLDPRPEDVRIEDIAHALALQTRFAGATRLPYSIGEHSVRVSWVVPPADALLGLMHDAAEYMCVDLPKPIKRGLPDYEAIEARVHAAICQRFDLPVALPASVKHADLVLLATEARDLLGPPPAPWDPLPPPLEERIEPWDWREAERRFLERFAELTERRP